jgi:enamine deaminase RidA (YjgF/YER057c/UK114 family)
MPPLPRPIAVPALYPGVPYHYAVATDGAPLVFTAGACPIDAEGRVPWPDDIEAQAMLMMDNLEAALVAAGSSLAQVVKTTVFVATADRAELRRAWREVVAPRFGTHRPPSTLIGVTVLGFDDQLVEIEAVALA